MERSHVKRFMLSFNSQVPTFHIEGPYESDSQWVHIHGEEHPGRLMMVEAPNGDQLGIYFKSDGTFEVGGWDEEGEWTPLTLIDYAVGKGVVTGTEFPLNQYTRHEVLDSTPPMQRPDKQ